MLKVLIDNNTEKALINTSTHEMYKAFSPYVSVIAYIPLMNKNSFIGCMFLANKFEEKAPFL